MKTLINKTSIFLFILLGAGCATNQQFVRLPDQSAKVEDSTKGRIYVIRPAAFVGAAGSFQVFDGRHLIGATGPKGYLCWERNPGKTVVTIGPNGLQSSSKPLSVEAGKAYFLQEHMVGLGHDLELLTEEKGRKLLQSCKAPKVMEISSDGE